MYVKYFVYSNTIVKLFNMAISLISIILLPLIYLLKLRPHQGGCLKHSWFVLWLLQIINEAPVFVLFWNNNMFEQSLINCCHSQRVAKSNKSTEKELKH